MGEVSDEDAYQRSDDTDASRRCESWKIIVTPLCNEDSQASKEASYAETQLRSPKDTIKKVLILRNTTEGPAE